MYPNYYQRKSNRKNNSNNSSGGFYSPLVRSIAARENLSSAELGSISGSGRHGRVRKEDLLGLS